MSRTRGVGLRTQILLIFLGAAILPLGIVGLWLTSSAVRSGENLLRSHLSESADRFAAAAASRWAYRQADLALISGNDAAVRAVTRDALSDVDRHYLETLAADVARTIPVLELRDLDGRVHWSSTPQSRAAAARAAGQDVENLSSRRDPPIALRVEMPIVDPSGTRVGTATTDVAVAAFVPPDSARPLVPGARLAVRNRLSGNVAVPLDNDVPFPASDRLELRGETWLAVHRELSAPRIDFAIAAPLTSYVASFRRAATLGVTALLVVAGLAVLLTIVLATRATYPLEQLALASDAVTSGDLNQRVGVAGPAEVRRVGTAFNLMTDNLRATLDALARRSAMAAVGEFATSLSHDVRNALTSIHVDLDRLSMRDLRDPTAEALVTRALNSVSRLETTVTGALRAARRGQSQSTDMDLRAPLRAAADIVSGAMTAVPAHLDVQLPTDPVPVRGDAAALQQLFANLLFNAAQAMSPGGEARLIAEPIDGGVNVIVADDGTGISASNLAKLETSFFSTKSNGTGIGLPIARQIVAAHGGTMVIESEEGRGTTVRVRLPAGTKRSRHVNESLQKTTAV